MFGRLLILHILRPCRLGLGSDGCLVPRIHFHSPIPLPKRSQLPEGIKDVCWNEKHTGRWSNFSITFERVPAPKLHGKVWIFLPVSCLLRQGSHNSINIVEHVMVDSDGVMHSNRMPFRHLQGQVLEWPQTFYGIPNNGLFILRSDERPVITVFRIPEPLAVEFS